MTNHETPITDVSRVASQNATAQSAFLRWSEVARQGIMFGILLVFASYVANLIVLPILTNGTIEDFIESPYRALQKLVSAFVVGISFAAIQARLQVTAKKASL